MTDLVILYADLSGYRHFPTVGWSNEASTLENPRPRPRISRFFEVEGSFSFKFRGFSSLRELL